MPERHHLWGTCNLGPLLSHKDAQMHRTLSTMIASVAESQNSELGFRGSTERDGRASQLNEVGLRVL